MNASRVPSAQRPCAAGLAARWWRVVVTMVALAAASSPDIARAQVAPSVPTVLAAVTGAFEEAGTRFPGEVVSAEPLFAPPEPRRLRPCCAFGGTMKVKVVGIPLPWYRHKPLRGPSDIGPHEYDPGVLQILPGPVHGNEGPKREHNGIVYTCRGGFLDTAHVRDFADLAWFLSARVESRLETGGSFDLIDYGGKRRITIRAVPREKIALAGRRRLAVAIAARLSFDLSVWREAATWYGYESVPPWPEKLSSFSPEDLYSNLLGTKLAEGILRTTDIRSRRDWDLAMTAWLPAVLEGLGVVPVETARELMDSVDNVFWSSSHWIPDWRITRRRKFDRGPFVEPWAVHGNATDRIKGLCGANDVPVALHVNDELAGVSIDDAAQIDVVASSRLVRHGLPLPHEGDRHIVEADFDRIIEAVRQETEAGLAREEPKHTQAARLY